MSTKRVFFVLPDAWISDSGETRGDAWVSHYETFVSELIISHHGKLYQLHSPIDRGV